MITGPEKPDAGELKVASSVKLSYVEQSRDVLKAGQTVWQVISDGLEMIKLGSVQMNSRAYVSRFGFTGQDQQKDVAVLSGGERNRVHLARILKDGGNVLLLDEPTNDLDVNTIRALEEALENFAGCAVVISHDRWFLDRLATTFSHSKARATSSGSTATTQNTKPTAKNASASRRISPTASSTAS